jgi:HD-GYP domain-containing protein (c-di-GMP phosphodiesterase class II)
VTREGRPGPDEAAGSPSEELRAAFRVLAGGDDVEAGAFLERACAALAADEGTLLLAGADPGDHLAGHHHGTPGPEGRLGDRPRDRHLYAQALASGRPYPAGPPGGPELWCAMAVEGRPAGVLALRREQPSPFRPADHAAIEVLATGAAVATDRLRFLRLWSDKLDQADAAHSQLLRYADDLRTTYAAERRQAEELRRALGELELSYTATVRALATAVEAKDAYTGGHLARVTEYGVSVCQVIGGGLAATPGLEEAFLLHDLGKIGVPDAVLNKPGPLTDEEWVLMREHPAIGLRILDGVPHMDVVRQVVYCHHERWDGTGYPEGLKAEDIPLAARVFSTVDAFDAITTDRPYRQAASLDEALARLQQAAGTQFAPDAVDALHQVDPDQLDAIRATAARRR